MLKKDKHPLNLEDVQEFRVLLISIEDEGKFFAC